MTLADLIHARALGRLLQATASGFLRPFQSSSPDLTPPSHAWRASWEADPPEVTPAQPTPISHAWRASWQAEPQPDPNQERPRVTPGMPEPMPLVTAPTGDTLLWGPYTPPAPTGLAALLHAQFLKRILSASAAPVTGLQGLVLDQIRQRLMPTPTGTE